MGRTAGLLLGVIAMVVGVWALILATPTGSTVSAHNELCPDGQPIRWAGTWATHWWPISWDASYQNAIANGTTNFNTSDFDWFWTSDDTTADVVWANYNNPDLTIAGANLMFRNCTTHTFYGGVMYFNFPHFNASSHTQGQKQCTSIHEQGHGVGLDHNDVFTSIMKVPHSQRCHVQLIDILYSHDVSDINAKY
jgi:hypothetical protein